MKEQVVDEVFEVYEILKDSLKITRKSIHKELFLIPKSTLYVGEPKTMVYDRINSAIRELDDIMVLSLFASFERELRTSIQNVFDSNMNKSNNTVERLSQLTTESIERWTVIDMVNAFKDVVDISLLGQIKQIYEYRNWVAHGKNQAKTPSVKTDPKVVWSVLKNFIKQASVAI